MARLLACQRRLRSFSTAQAPGPWQSSRSSGGDSTRGDEATRSPEAGNAHPRRGPTRWSSRSPGRRRYPQWSSPFLFRLRSHHRLCSPSQPPPSLSLSLSSGNGDRHNMGIRKPWRCSPPHIRIRRRGRRNMEVNPCSLQIDFASCGDFCSVLMHRLICKSSLGSSEDVQHRLDSRA
ncbi:uncharacterized protein LOC120655729 isoform X1 [Panicum virgatum]|uniref:Uncharacterized protein n=1 Tax=Panicum virgatum TaxID=38727 RepID=A0A8T0WVT9_PANVG|nr:uncharacterized protein LOC120655729 isoform X1 [Panicum virgatum]KAG2650928.1 hypothetical protein PVAP13_1NG157319 [Panicum virgatum]